MSVEILIKWKLAASNNNDKTLSTYFTSNFSDFQSFDVVEKQEFEFLHTPSGERTDKET